MNYRKSVLIYGRNVARKTHLLTSFVFIHLHFLQVFSIFQNHKQIKLCVSFSLSLCLAYIRQLHMCLCRFSIIYIEDLFYVQISKRIRKKERIVVQIGFMRTKIPVKIIYLKVFIMKSTKYRMRNGKRYEERKREREYQHQHYIVENSPSVGVN